MSAHDATGGDSKNSDTENWPVMNFVVQYIRQRKSASKWTCNLIFNTILFKNGPFNCHRSWVEKFYTCQLCHCSFQHQMKTATRYYLVKKKNLLHLFLYRQKIQYQRGFYQKLHCMFHSSYQPSGIQTSLSSPFFQAVYRHILLKV